MWSLFRENPVPATYGRTRVVMFFWDFGWWVLWGVARGRCSEAPPVSIGKLVFDACLVCVNRRWTGRQMRIGVNQKQQIVAFCMQGKGCRRVDWRGPEIRQACSCQ